MRNHLQAFLSLTAAALTPTLVQAQPVVTVTPHLGVGGFDYYVFHVDPAGVAMDTIDMTITTFSATFVGENVPAVVEFSSPATVPNTDVLGLGTVALGWSILTTSDSPTLLAAAGGPLGLNITAPVDFAQVVFPEGALALCGLSAQFNFADNGTLVGSTTLLFAWPEPSSLLLLISGSLTLAVVRLRPTS